VDQAPHKLSCLGRHCKFDFYSSLSGRKCDYVIICDYINDTYGINRVVCSAFNSPCRSHVSPISCSL